MNLLTRVRLRARLAAVATATSLVVAPLAVGAPAHADLPGAAVPPGAVVASPLDDPFYDYEGETPLEQIAPGTVLKTRTIPYRVQGLALPLRAHQLLYRTRDAQGAAVTNVTTVVRPAVSLRREARVVSYQSFYDSLNPADQPSAAIAGGVGLGRAIVNVETLLIKPLLLAGYTINIPDTEGQGAHFAAGTEYGYTTLDSLRALPQADVTRVDEDDPIGLIGYSGGAIASGWAAELAESYAPEVADDIVGTAMGGVLVHPAKNLDYVEGTSVWAGVAPMALVGIGRAFDVDFDPYLSPRGREIFAEMQDASIAEVLGAYPGLRWADLVKPEFTEPTTVPEFVDIANQLIMGTYGTPTAPMFIGQGTGGELEGTPAGGANIGRGDGVMIAGDVRTLARQYCDDGVDVRYREYGLSHLGSAAAWLPEAYGWLISRFGPLQAPNNCASIAPGNSLAPIEYTGD